MTSSTAAKSRAATARTEAAATNTSPDVQVKGVNRREFLYYIWGASMALLLAEAGGAIIWFALPRFRAGEFGGVFPLTPNDLPPTSEGPAGYPAGKFWLSNNDDGLYALSMVCTHLGCLFKWVPSNNRFECPCHGSKFQKNGTYIEGPAPRNLDRYAVTVMTPGGTVATDAEGGPVKIDGATEILVDTGKKIKGHGHA
jgi:cytochrome b6-f complex iron-sulfur subunit